MAKEYNSEELVSRTFFFAMVGVGLFVMVVFLFIL
jgi:hypothetical protein